MILQSIILYEGGEEYNAGQWPLYVEVKSYAFSFQRAVFDAYDVAIVGRDSNYVYM